MKTTWKTESELNIPEGYRLLSGNDTIQSDDVTIWTFAGSDPQWKQVDPAHIGKLVGAYSVIRKCNLPV